MLNVVADLLTVREIAAQCRVSLSTVYRWIQEGRLRALRLGRRHCYRVTREAFRQFLADSGEY